MINIESAKGRLAVLSAIGVLVLGACGSSVSPTPQANQNNLAVIGGADRANQEYVWISQDSTLPLFVNRVYPGLQAAAKSLNVKVRVAGPTAIDLAAFIATVETECARHPAGVIVVGGWDQALSASVDKCIDQKVPTIVTDGDLPQSKRLVYVGTDWLTIGTTHGSFMVAELNRRGIQSGDVATIAPLAGGSFDLARQGFKETVEAAGFKVAANEDDTSQVDVAATKTKALLSAYPNLVGIAGFDSEAGPGIVAGIDEAGKVGKLVVTVQESGDPAFFNTLKQGKTNLVLMDKYETMNFLAINFLYAFHNQMITNLNIDPWVNSPLPNKVDTGLISVTKDTVDSVLAGLTPAGSAQPSATP